MRVSLAAANRDPGTFPAPDAFDVHRHNAGLQLAFARGPHACLGMHLARIESFAAVDAALDLLPGLRPGTISPPTGLVFRRPEQVRATWQVRVSDAASMRP